ncbi:unnamed protein product [Brachionus calyciflorus]|uniref:Peroxin-7 n=1 Tax=Brachionus calyciflorus TaxID=104777 RepID=A0A813M328_9BILA|nr:unnamed protein product [Brachionus calyciflorus]
MRQLSLLYTANQQCYGVQYAPNNNSILACISCDKFGISGSASMYIIQHSENSVLESKFQIIDSFRFGATLFDIDWSSIDHHLILTGNGDGSIAIWKWPPVNNINPYDRKPIYVSKEHKKEVYSVQWEPSGMRSYHLLSASWDKTIKIWNLNNTGLTCLVSLDAHDGMVYSGAWNPKMTGLLLSGSADKTFRFWDVNKINTRSPPIFVSKPNSSDILCADWSAFDQNIFTLGYASGLIEIRDYRNMKEPVHSIQMAHDYAIKKIKFSPHIPDLFASVSYDMTTKIWNLKGQLIDESKNHSEFAYGIDFDPLIPNRLVDCGWDRKVVISEFQVPGLSSRNVLI